MKSYSYIRDVKKPLWVQYNPSYKCNLRCPWCYNKEQWTQKQVMSQNTINKTVEMLYHSVKRYDIDGLCISLLGGEPTLFPETVLSIVQSFATVSCPKVFWLFTNGVALTENLIKQFHDAGIFIVLACNESPMAFVEEKIKLIEKYQSVIRLSVTLSKFNLRRLPDIAESSLKLGYFLRLFVEHKGYEQQSYLEEYTDGVCETFKVLEQSKGPRRRFNLLYEHFLPFWKEEKTPYITGSRFVSVDHDGTLWGYNGTREVGKFGVAGNIDFLERLWLAVDLDKVGRWSAKNLRECDGCKVRNICQGGYPVPKYHAYGTWKVKSPYCELYKEMIPKFVELYYSIPE